MTAAAIRPRLLYTAAFAWLAVTGGRFLAPFLQHQADYSDVLVGTVLAAQTAVFSLLGSAGGSWADARERSFPRKGRAQVMFTGVALGSTAFMLHGASLVVPSLLLESMEWHFLLRILWACSCSLVMPVLDGMALGYLEKTPGMDPSDYGKERLYGAISWAIVNLMIGPIVDHFGFISLYPFAMIVMVLYFWSIAAFVHGQEESAAEGEVHVVPQHETFTSFSTSIQDDESIRKDHHRVSADTTKVPIQSLLGILVGSIYGASFLVAVVCLSSGMAVVESLIFLFFEVLGGTNTMCGITVALTVLFEIPIFAVAPKLLYRLGSASLLGVAACSYIVRVVGYSLIPKGHVAFVLLLEPLHGVTYACAQTSTVHFAASVVPKGSEASGQGLLGVFKGLGSVTGLFLGGLLEETLGPRIMYRIFATIVAVGMIVLGFASSACLSPRRNVGAASARHAVLPQSETELSEISSKEDMNESADDGLKEVAVVEFI